MAIRAVFGIHKHLDATIPELNGARRDATALWALHTGTVKGLSARILVDQKLLRVDIAVNRLGSRNPYSHMFGRLS